MMASTKLIIVLGLYLLLGQSKAIFDEENDEKPPKPPVGRHPGYPEELAGNTIPPIASDEQSNDTRPSIEIRHDKISGM